MIFSDKDCVGCGACAEVCVGGAFSFSGSYTAKFDPELCLECDECLVTKECMGECLRK